MTSTISARRIKSLLVSSGTPATHGVPAIHPVSGDLCVVYHQGSGNKSVYAAIFRRSPISTLDNPDWQDTPQYFDLGLASAGVYGANDSCSHPWVTPIKDGFATFWFRKDASIGNTTMTIGASVEMAKLTNATGYEYTKYASATAGKGYVLDNQIIAGDVGGYPRADWFSENLVGLVYGHQATYALTTGDTVHERTASVRGAYINFAANGKPSLISGGNRTAGSASDVDDGGFAAGATPHLQTGIDLDDLVATPVFASGGLLPTCCFDMRGDFSIAYEVRNGGSGQGGIVMRTYHGPFRESGLDTAALYNSTADHNGGAAPNLARRPMLACRRWEEGRAISGTDYPPMLLTYGNQVPGSPDSGTVTAKTITFPISGAAPTIAALTLPTNTNYDATTEEQTLPTCVDSRDLSAFFIECKLKNVAGGAGRKFVIAHSDATTNEVLLLNRIAYPSRLNVKTMLMPDGSTYAAMTYEGQQATGGGAESVYADIWLF